MTCFYNIRWHSCQIIVEIEFSFKYEYGAKTGAFGCPLPCMQTSFVHKITYNHINTW